MFLNFLSPSSLTMSYAKLSTFTGAVKSRRKTSTSKTTSFILSALYLSALYSTQQLASAVDYGALIVGRCQAAHGTGRCVASADSCRIVGGIIGTNPVLNETLEDGQIPFRGRAAPLPTWNCLKHESCCIIPPLAQPNACSTCGVLPAARNSEASAAAQNTRTQLSNSVDDDESSTLAPLKLRSTFDNSFSLSMRRGLEPRLVNPNGQARDFLNIPSPITSSWCWHAALVDRHTGSVFGSAVLIAQAWLLTVAHKLRNRTPADFFVVLGERNFGLHNDDSRVALVRDVIIHPRFNLSTFANDIALLRIADAPCNGRNICTACLGSVDDTASLIDDGSDASDDMIVVEERRSAMPPGDVMEEVDVNSNSNNNLYTMQQQQDQNAPGNELQARLSPLPPLDKIYGLNREFRSLNFGGYQNNNNPFGNMQQPPQLRGRSGLWPNGPQMGEYFNRPQSMNRPAAPFSAAAIRPRTQLKPSARQLTPVNSTEPLGSAIPPISFTQKTPPAATAKDETVITISSDNNNNQQPDQQERRNPNRINHKMLGQVIGKVLNKPNMVKLIDPDTGAEAEYYKDEYDTDLPNIGPNMLQNSNAQRYTQQQQSSASNSRTGGNFGISTGEVDEFNTVPHNEFRDKFQQALGNVRRQQQKKRDNRQEQRINSNSDASSSRAKSSIKAYMKQKNFYDNNNNNNRNNQPQERRRTPDYYENLSEPSAATLKTFGPLEQQQKFVASNRQNFRERSQSAINDWLSEQQQRKIERPRQTVQLRPLGSRNSLRSESASRRQQEQQQVKPVSEVFSRCVVTGWGASNNTTQPPSLQQSSVELRTNSQCINDMHRNQVTASAVPSTMICARGADRMPLSMCEGDGGGPLVCQLAGTDVWYLEGLAALGASVDCETKSTAPSMYVRVGLYRSWIEKNLIAFLEQQQQQQNQHEPR